MNDLDTYLTQVKRNLRALPRRLRGTVYEEVTLHVGQELAAGHSPALLITRLGPAKELADAVVAGWIAARDRERTVWGRVWLAAVGASSAALFALGLTSVLASISVAAMWQPALREAGAPLRDLFWTLLLELPGNSSLGLPLAAMFFGLSGVVTLARWTRPEAFRRMLPRVFALGLLVGVLWSGAGFLFEEHVAVPANRALSDYEATSLLHHPVSSLLHRSPQELTYPELAARIEGDRYHIWGGVPPEDANAALRQWDDPISLQHKLALPAFNFSMLVFGLAIGVLFSVRRWPVLPAGIIGCIVWNQVMVAMLQHLSPQTISPWIWWASPLVASLFLFVMARWPRIDVGGD